MKLIISLGNKTINVKEKDLLKKLSGIVPELQDNISFEKIFTEAIPFNVSDIAGKSSIKSEHENAETAAIADNKISSNPAEENISVLQSITAGREIIEQLSSENTSPAGDAERKKVINDNFNENNYSFGKTSTLQNQETGSQYGSEFDNHLNTLSRKINLFTDSAGSSFKKMWDELVSNGKKAKDPWDAVWLSLRNSAIKRIGEILKTELFNDLFSQLTGGASSGGFLGTIISGIAGLFTGGGVLAKTGSAAFSAGAAPAVSTFNNFNTSYYTNKDLVSSFNKYAEAAEKWQRELRVVNDLFENNRGIKTVQEYLNKVKS